MNWEFNTPRQSQSLVSHVPQHSRSGKANHDFRSSSQTNTGNPADMIQLKSKGSAQAPTIAHPKTNHDDNND
jgi:hypothetical protein